MEGEDDDDVPCDGEEDDPYGVGVGDRSGEVDAQRDGEGDHGGIVVEHIQMAVNPQILTKLAFLPLSVNLLNAAQILLP